MKFTFKKSIAVAALAMAFTGQASAMVQGNNGTLFLSVWDTSVGGTFSYGQDLGYNINSFLDNDVSVVVANGGPAVGDKTPDAGLTLNFGTNFLSQYTGSLSTLAWNVVSADSSAGALTANSNRVITTIKTGNGVGALTNSGLNTVRTGIASTAINGHSGCVAVGSNCVNNDPGSAGWAGGPTFGDTLGNANLSTSNSLGSVMEMLYISQNGTTPGNATAVLPPVRFANANGNATWTLSSAGQLTYSVAGAPAAVPIPAAALLFGSGLLGLVGIGRRNKKSS